MRILISFLLILSTHAFAAKKAQNTKEVMLEALVSIANIIPLADNDDKFTKKTNEKFIYQNLLNISKAFERGSHLRAFKAPGFRPSLELIRSHVKDTVDAFNTDYKVFARSRFNATAAICMSCHNQLPEFQQNVVKKFKGTNPDYFKNDINYATFLFLIRDYNSAEKHFEKHIDKKLAENKEFLKRNRNMSSRDLYYDKSINTAFMKLLQINLKVFYKPNRVKKLIEKYSYNPNAPDLFKSDLRDWSKDFSDWLKSPFGNITDLSEAKLQKLVTEYLPNKYGKIGENLENVQQITSLAYSGILFRKLNKSKKYSYAPSILLWLGIFENNLEDNFFYSLSELYLKECIERYPNSNYAKQCFRRYEDDIVRGFTGSSGTHVPDEVKSSLENLGKKVKLKPIRNF